MTKLEKDFYKEIKHSMDNYLKSFNDALADKDYDLIWSDCENEYKILQNSNLNKEQVRAMQVIIKEIVEGVIHSMFVSIDGGTALSSEGKALELIDLKTNKPLTEGALHENFMEVIEE